MTDNQTPVENKIDEDEPADGLWQMLKPGKTKQDRVYVGVMLILFANNLGFGIYSLAQGAVLLGALRLVIALTIAIIYFYSRLVRDLLKANRHLIEALEWSHDLNLKFIEAYDKAQEAEVAAARQSVAEAAQTQTYAPYKPSEN